MLNAMDLLEEGTFGPYRIPLMVKFPGKLKLEDTTSHGRHLRMSTFHLFYDRQKY